MIVVILTDEADGQSANNPWKTHGGPQDWFSTIVADRGGIDGNIVDGPRYPASDG